MGDYIKREDALNAIVCTDYCRFDNIKNIRSIPAADVREERRSGWKMLTERTNGMLVCGCLQCDGLSVFDPHEPDMFCKHCGAIMDGTSIIHPALDIAKRMIGSDRQSVEMFMRMEAEAKEDGERDE